MKEQASTRGTPDAAATLEYWKRYSRQQCLAIPKDCGSGDCGMARQVAPPWVPSCFRFAVGLRIGSAGIPFLLRQTVLLQANRLVPVFVSQRAS